MALLTPRQDLAAAFLSGLAGRYEGYARDDSEIASITCSNLAMVMAYLYTAGKQGNPLEYNT